MSDQAPDFVNAPDQAWLEPQEGGRQPAMTFWGPVYDGEDDDE